MMARHSVLSAIWALSLSLWLRLGLAHDRFPAGGRMYISTTIVAAATAALAAVPIPVCYESSPACYRTVHLFGRGQHFVVLSPPVRNPFCTVSSVSICSISVESTSTWGALDSSWRSFFPFGPLRLCGRLPLAFVSIDDVFSRRPPSLALGFLFFSSRVSLWCPSSPWCCCSWSRSVFFFSLRASLLPILTRNSTGCKWYT